MAKDLNMCVLLDIYGPLISDKQFEIMDCYYNQDYSLAEISELSGITRQGVRDSIKRAEHVMIECEEKLGLVEKFRENRRGAELMREAIEVLRKISIDGPDSLILKEQLKKLSDGLSALQL